MAVKKKIVKEKNKMGRPSKFETINMKQIEKLYKDGKTDKFVCDFFGINESTLTGYKKKYPDFFTSIKDWKIEADADVEKSLYERAKGYSCPDTHVSTYNGSVILTDLIKHYPPDPTSMIFWLKNRNPKDWRDRIEHTGKDGEQLISEVKITIVK